MVELRCPFCRAVLAPHVTACHRCRATRRTRKGMSPLRFRLFFSTWMALVVSLLLAGCWVGFAPWGPNGSPPAYALALVGSKASAGELVRCRVEVVAADGSRSVKLMDEQCRVNAATGEPSPNGTQPSTMQRRIATALHTVLSLLAALAVSGALLPLVRLAFLKKSRPSWIRRAPAGPTRPFTR